MDEIMRDPSDKNNHGRAQKYTSYISTFLATLQAFRQGKTQNIEVTTYTSLFVGWTFTSTCSGGNTIDMYMKGFDALGSVAA